MTLDQLLAKWLGKEKAGERAEYQQFLTELAQALDVPTPGDAGVPAEDYRFEAPVRSEAVYGGTGTKRIDLYKRGCFILEAKQSQLGEGEIAPPEPEAVPAETVYDLFGTPVGTAPATRKPRRRYDRLMEDARVQAQRYALALPEHHPTPSFLIVADIGRAFELYFDWAGNGRGYRPFPDERGYRVALADLANDAPLAGVDVTAADLLRAIWTDPASVDPRTRAAKVTRDIAVLLSRVATQLEKEEIDARRPNEIGLGLRIEETSLFLMRTLFCMFAEDVGLLEKDSFKRFLGDAEGRSAQFWRSGLEELWRRMNDPLAANRYWSHGDTIVRYFNGNLFSNARVFDLPAEAKNILRIAADQDWRAVEPAIFGTLLEQVLTTGERAKLGAHYTPRRYVERLVQATIMDVLTPEWEAVRDRARAMLTPLPEREGSGVGGPTRDGRLEPTHPQPLPFREGSEEEALALVTAFHQRLLAIRVLDPACGTGNFLYVAMEALLRLEGEVRQFVAALGGTLVPAVHPNQFLGLELNPRAGVIAELVLWIGWLRYRLANTPDIIGGQNGDKPVLPPLTNINGGTHGVFDAVLVRTATGEPDVANPRRPDWPPADFIVGNPPFIGGKDLRDRLGGEYAQALWAANPRVPKSADFVMHWWDRAADILTRPGTRLRRFGFVTTNSITQVFSRRVIEGWLAAPLPFAGGVGGGPSASDGAPGREGVPTPNPFRKREGDGEGAPLPPAGGVGGGPSAGDGVFGGEGVPTPQPPPASGRGSVSEKLHLVLAIPDHPWTRVTRDAAAVRIAMTVAAAGRGEGRLVEIVREAKLDRDDPVLEERATPGVVNADLSVGTDVTKVAPLKANEGLCSPGVKLHGAGFIVTPEQARALGLGTRPGLEAHIRDYRHGRDLLQRPRGVMVIDLFGLSEQEVMERFPEVYQHLRRTVYDKTWNPKANKGKGAWEGREVNPRPSYEKFWWIFGEPRRELRPALAGIPRYIATTETSKHRVFQFVDPSVVADNMLVVIADSDPAMLGVLSSSIHTGWVMERGGWLGFGNDNRYSKSLVFDPFPFPDRSDAVAAIAERLDATRRAALAEGPSLTMTGLYNLVEEVRAGTPLSPQREAEIVRARARIVAKLHDDLDAAVAHAYGWGEEWAAAPLPPAEIVRRLVALNAQRAAAEKDGRVRWLRPEYQRGRFGG